MNYQYDVVSYIKICIESNISFFTGKVDDAVGVENGYSA
jgi:hypothetical protein